MSLNAMHRSVMIYSDDQEKAIKKMNSLVSDMEMIERNKNFVKTKEKTFQARKFSENCRGYRYREVYVDEALKDNEEIMFLIRAKLVPPHYYNNEEHDESYNWRNHLHFFKA